MKYLKKFQTETDYNTFKNGSDFKSPNLSGIVELKRVKYNKHTPVPKTTFTVINNSYTGTGSFISKTYAFVEGMTWAEWVNSQYNTDGFFVPDSYYENIIRFKNENYVIGTTSNKQDIRPSSIIIAGATYYINTWSCFAAGTQILVSLDGTTKNIEDITVGDDIISYNIANNENYETIVTHAYKNAAVYNMAKVTCADGTVLEMAEPHPLYTKDGWKSITRYHGYPELKEGDVVKTIDDWSEITSIERYTLDEPIAVYTLNVKDEDEEIDVDTNDNYYANGVLAHNKSSK